MADKKKSVAKAYVQVVPTVDGIKDTLTKEFGGEVSSSFGDIFKGTLLSGALLGAAKEIGGAILDIGKDAVEAAADVKAANAQFTQTFSGLEGTAKAALRAVSNETGIATTRLQNGYTALYAFTKSVGGDSETALNIAQRALKAAADSAAYYDRSVEDATETLMSFVKGNYANDAALGIAATETTRNAKANELYAKSFKELSESQKVDVLLAMVEAGNQASGALGQAAREADSWVNVTGELGEAGRQLLAIWGSPILEGLAPLLAGVTEQLNAMMEPRPIQVLNAGIESFRDGIHAASAELEDSNTSMAAQAELAQRYVDRLRQLEGAGLETAESQREYAQTVDLLNELMPDLNLTINENTGRLDQNTWAIEDNIQALREQAEHQAKMAYYKDVQDAYTDAYKERYAAEKALTELQVQEIALSEQLTAATAEYTAAEGEARKEAYNRMLLAQADYNINISRQQELIGSINELNTELEAHGNLLDESAQNQSELAGAAGEATAAVDEQSEAVAELTKAYNDSKLAARESIDSQIGLFDELEKKSEMSAKEIVKNWKDQQKAFTEYGDNLKKAVDLGLDQALVQQLSDGSQQSMLILDELLNGTTLSIDEINEAFGGMSEARDTLAGTMAEMEAIANGTYDDMVAAAQDAGENVVDGLVAGIYEHIPRLEQSMGTAAKKAAAAYNRTMEIRSPSRVMARAGGYTVAGAVQGVEDNIWKMEQAMAELGDRSVAAYNRDIVMDAAAYQISGIAGSTNAASHNNTVSYGNINFTINQQPGEDADALVDRVMERLNVLCEQGGAAFG